MVWPHAENLFRPGSDQTIRRRLGPPDLATFVNAPEGGDQREQPPGWRRKARRTVGMSYDMIPS